MACLIILYFKNNLYFAVNQLANSPINWSVVKVSSTVLRKSCHDPDFARISLVYLITGFTLVADQQFVVECGYK